MYNKSEIETELNNLQKKQIVAFSASCSERLLPIYEAFVITENWGNLGFLREALNLVWFYILDSSNDEKIKKYIKQLSRFSPNAEDDFKTLFLGGAQMAVANVKNTLKSCLTEDTVKLATESSYNCIYAIESYLFSVNNPFISSFKQSNSFYDWLRQSPLLEIEYESQKNDLSLLKSITDVDDAVIEKLRSSSSKLGIRPFSRGITVKPTKNKSK